MVDTCRNKSPRMKAANAPWSWSYGPFSEQGDPPHKIRWLQQIEEGHTTHQDNPFSPGTCSQSQPVSEKTAENNLSSKTCNVKEIASTILAIFGLSDTDFGEFSRYPDHQLTPENMPFILKDIRLRKIARLPSLAAQSKKMKTFCSEQLKCSSRYWTGSQLRSPEQPSAGSSRSQGERHLPSPRLRSRSPWRSQDSSSLSPRSSSKERRLGRSSRSPGSSAEARLSPQTKKQHDQLAPPEKCPSNHLDLQDEATRQERPSSKALQGEQPHSNSEHSALTSLAEKSVLQAMSQFQSGAAGGVGSLAAGEIVSMVQLVAAQVVQAVLASKNPLGLPGSGDRALAGPGATPGLSSEPEKVEEKPEALLHSEGVMVASPGPEGITAGPGLQETPCESSQAEKQELLACSGAEMASPGPETRAATLDSVADISESSKAEKQELAPCPAVQPKVVWICGHDVVQLAREHAVKFWKGDQLGLSDKLTIKWLSQKGMQWNELVPMLEKEAAANVPADVIVLQLGDNDLFKISDDDLKTTIQQDLLWCLQRFPGVKILWSVLLPFPGWCPNVNYNKMNKRRKIINHFVASFLVLQGGNINLHPNITPKIPSMYSEDGLCLSEKGLGIWLHNVCSGLMRLLELSPPKKYKMRKHLDASGTI